MSVNSNDWGFGDKELSNSLNFQNVFSRTPPTATPSSYGHQKFLKKQRVGSMHSRFRSLSQIEAEGLISTVQKGKLKELICLGDENLIIALEKYELGDPTELQNFLKEGLEKRPSIELIEDLEVNSPNANQNQKEDYLTFQFDMDDPLLQNDFFLVPSNEHPQMHDTTINLQNPQFDFENADFLQFSEQHEFDLAELGHPFFGSVPQSFTKTYHLDSSNIERNSLDLANSDHNQNHDQLIAQIQNLSYNEQTIFNDYNLPNEDVIDHSQTHQPIEEEKNHLRFDSSHHRQPQTRSNTQYPTSHHQTRSSSNLQYRQQQQQQQPQQTSNTSPPSHQLFSVSHRVSSIPQLAEISNAFAPPYDQLVNFSRAKTKENIRCVMCGRSPQEGNCSIPSQNKDVCKECDKSNWFHAVSGIYFKWCKGCKNFLNIRQFAERLDASKCDRCRARGRQGYLQKKGKDTGRGSKSADHSSTNYHQEQVPLPSSRFV